MRFHFNVLAVDSLLGAVSAFWSVKRLASQAEPRDFFLFAKTKAKGEVLRGERWRLLDAEEEETKADKVEEVAKEAKEAKEEGKDATGGFLARSISGPASNRYPSNALPTLPLSLNPSISTYSSRISLFPSSVDHVRRFRSLLCLSPKDFLLSGSSSAHESETSEEKDEYGWAVIYGVPRMYFFS
ncbi:hypothetical protein KM043_003964 [Ampulex compressa]|nr:hypothetical protein KM043_003964 [Ampulex compressa]